MPRLTEAALRRAAKVAREEGVQVEVEVDGKIYRLAPAKQTEPVNPADLVEP